MNMVSMGKTRIADNDHKRIVEARHKIIDRCTNATHQLIFTELGDGSYELETLVDEDSSNSIEYLIGMTVALEEIKRHEEIAQMMAAVDEAMGGMLLPILVGEMISEGIDVPQELMDLVGDKLITVIDKHAVN